MLVQSTAGSAPSTKPSSSPDNSNSLNKVPLVHKHTSNAPAPLNLAPKRRGLSPNRMLRRSGSTSGCPTSPPPTSSIFVSSSSRYQPSPDDSLQSQRLRLLQTQLQTPLPPSYHPHHPCMTCLRHLMPTHIKYMRSFFW